MTPDSIKRERARLKRNGFPGKPARAPLWVWSGDRTHYIAARVYRLPGSQCFEPQDVNMIEIWETHDRRKRARIIPARDLVHFAINAEPTEVALLAARRRP